MHKEENNGVTIHGIYYELADLENDIWKLLLNGSLKSKDPFHTASIATISVTGISLRTVVLRKVIVPSKIIRFHTDKRSGKWTELKKNNNISALLYNGPSRIQLRLKGKAILHQNDEVTEDSWQRTSLSGRRSYLTTNSPSSTSNKPTSGLALKYETEDFTLEESEVGKVNFGVISVEVDSIDWLWLNHAGHRRAFFNYSNNQFNWLIP